MMKRLSMITSVLALIALFTIQAAAKEITVRGQLGRTVEAGGWLIIADTDEQTTKYLLLNSKRFQNEKWFRDGVTVEATGEPKPDAVTIYQEGIPFEARTLQQVGSSSAHQTASAKGPTRVIVSGEAVVQAQPDTAILIISVVTQNKNAQAAQAENAAQSDAVIRALKSAAGATAEIKTSGYSLTPQRIYKENMPPTITGYEARNTVTVTLSELTRVGAVIDAATQAGANNVDGISFTLRKDRPAQSQALSEATRAAVAKAQVLAQALGGRVTRIVEVQEGGTMPRPLQQIDRIQTYSAAQSTPIEVGTLDIRSQVQLIAEIE